MSTEGLSQEKQAQKPEEVARESAEDMEDRLRVQSLLDPNVKGFSSDTTAELLDSKKILQENHIQEHSETVDKTMKIVGSVWLGSTITGEAASQALLPPLANWLGTLKLLGVAAGAFVPAVISGKMYASYMTSREQRKEEALEEVNDNLGIFNVNPDLESVQEVLDNSYAIDYRQVDDFPGLEGWQNPSRAATDYELIVELLEEGGNFWRDEQDPKLEAVTLEDLDEYSPEQLEYINDIPDLVEDEYEAIISDFRDEFTTRKEEENRFNQVIRYKMVEDPQIGEAVVYKLEMYQGDEIHTEINGIVDPLKFDEQISCAESAETLPVEIEGRGNQEYNSFMYGGSERIKPVLRTAANIF